MAKQGLRAGAPASTSAWCLGSLSAKAAQRAVLSTTDLQHSGSSSALRDQASSMVIHQCGQGTWTSRLSLRRSLSEGLSKPAMPQSSVSPELPCSTSHHGQRLGLGQSRQQECLTEEYGEHHGLHLDWWLPRSLYVLSAVQGSLGYHSQTSCSPLALAASCKAGEQHTLG